MNTSERQRVSSAVTPSTLLRYLESAASSSTPWMEYCGTNLVVKTPVACIEVWEQHCRRVLHQIAFYVWKQNSKSSADLQVNQTIIKLSFFFLSPNYPVNLEMGQGYRNWQECEKLNGQQHPAELQISLLNSALEKLSVHVFVCMFVFCQHWTCTGNDQLFHLTYMSNKNENIWT